MPDDLLHRKSENRKQWLDWEAVVSNQGEKGKGKERELDDVRSMQTCRWSICGCAVESNVPANGPANPLQKKLAIS